MGKKILRYVLRGFLVLILLLLAGLGSLYWYLNTAPGRRFLASEVGYYAGKAFGSDFTIGSAKWNFPATVSLENIVIKDQRHNNMFVIDKLNAGLIYFNYKTKKMIFSGVLLQNVDFNLVRYPGDSNSNFGYVIGRLSGGNGTSTHKTDIFFTDVEIENLHFRWNDQNIGTISYPGIDWNHIDVKRFDGKFSSLKIDGNDVSAKMKSLSLNETSGFVISQMKGEAKYTPRNIEVNDLDLITPNSRVRNHVRLDYTNTDSMADFVNNVFIKANFVNSKVSFKDLKYFTPDLKNKTDDVNLVRVTGQGKISDLHITDLEASYGKYSVVKGRTDIQGLPNIDKTVFITKIAHARTSREELGRLFPELPIPKELEQMGPINLKGSFNGYLSNFKTNTEFETALGSGKLDATLKILPDEAMSSYNGKIDLGNFDIGKLFGESLLGNITASGNVDGTGLSLETVQAHFKGDIRRFDFKRYSYQNIKVDGEVSKKFFKGMLNVNDPNLALDFKGSLDYRNQKPVYDFTADIQGANLQALNLSPDSMSVSTKLSINVEGIKPDDIDGLVIARQTHIILQGKSYGFDSMSLYSVVSPHKRIINLQSDLVQAKINGDFQLSRLGEFLKSAARHYVDANLYQFHNENLSGQYINFDIKFINLEPVFTILKTNFSAKDSGFLKGNIYSDGSKFVLNGNLPDFSYRDLHFKELVFKGKGDKDGLNLDINAGAFINRDTELVRDAVIKLKSNSEKLFFDIQGKDFLNQKQADISGSFDAVPNGQSFLDISSSSKIKILDSTWHISAQRIIFYKDTLVSIPGLILTRGNEKVQVEGEYGRKHSYPLRFVMANLDLAAVGNFLPSISRFGGSVNGQIVVSNLNAKPIVESALYISSASYNGDTLGTLSAQTSYDENTSRVSIDAGMYNGNGDQIAKASGAVNIDQTHALALNINLNQSEIKLFEPFINSVFSRLKGEATANMIITGTLANPEISGGIDLTDAEFRVNYTNVKYHFTHHFTFSGRAVIVKDLEVYDSLNNKATVNGSFDLSNLSDIGLDINIAAKKIMALNTTQKINNLYFGKGFGTGRVSISGALDNLKFVIKMRTDKGTTFSMPISSGSSFYSYDYIKFINKSNYLKQVHEVKISGIELSMDLDITPDAFGQIIFDPRVGDIIEAHGKGNLRLDINSDGDFSMYGIYTITDGKYRFTALNGLVSKSFSINYGSTITWNGNPYDAQLNVQAIYTVRTSLLPLASATATDEEKNNYYSRVYPVEAQMNLKGSLFQPEIRLDFAVEELNEADPGTTDVETRINQIKDNQQDIDQQVVSLLVLNEFAPVDLSGSGMASGALNSAYNSGISSVGDLVAGQVNNWLSNTRGLENLHVGVSKTQEEFSVKLTKDLLQQRANISVGYDFEYNNYNTQLAYKLTPDGGVQVKAFGRTNNNPIIDQNSATQGVGIVFRREFDKISELFRKRTKKARNKP